MRAVRISGGRVEVAEVPDPEPGPGEALLRLTLAGICGTDLELLRGYAGFEGIPGHEFVARVERCDDPAWVGARVVGDINCGCGDCDFCLRGTFHHCENRTVLGIVGRDGAFAERFVLPTRNLVRVPAEMPDERAVFAEPTAAALRILEQVEVDPWRRVAVVGDGRLGLLVVQVLARRCHDVSLFGHHPGRVPLPVNVREAAAPAQPPRPSERFDLVVEATGTPDGLNEALRLVAPMGTVVLKSTHAGEVAFPPEQVVVPEVTLVGSRCGDLARSVEELQGSALATEPLVEDRYPLSRAEAAFEHAARPGALKVLLEPDSGP